MLLPLGFGSLANVSFSGKVYDFPGDKSRPARKADNLTAIYEGII
jgi:hypothetical protein